MKLDNMLLDSYKSDELILFLVKNFSERVPAQIAQISCLLQENDFLGAKRELHALKNSFGNIGANNAAEYCQNLEDMLGAKADDITGNVEKLSGMYAETKNALMVYWKDRENRAK